MSAVNWHAITVHKCQVVIYHNANFESRLNTYGSDTTSSITLVETEKGFKSLRLTHGCKLTIYGNDNTQMDFYGDVANLEDYGYANKATRFDLADHNLACTVRLFD